MNLQTSPEYSQRSLQQRLFDTFIAAHASVQSLPERHKAQLQAALSLSFSLIILVGSLATLQLIGFSALVVAGLVFSAISLVSYGLSRSNNYQRAPLVFVSGFAILVYTASLLGGYPGLFLTLTFAILFLLSNLFDFKWMAVFIAINLAAGLLVSVLFMPKLQGQEALNARAGILTIGLFVLLFAWYRGNLERLRLQEVAIAQIELEHSNADLRNAQQAADLRLSELRLAAEVGRSISQVRALDVMLKDAVELIRSNFDLYYVQVYLVDQTRNVLQLEAGTGPVGAELLSRHHSLSLDFGSINGRAATEKRSIVINDTATSATFRPNPLLPETRSEMSIPLIAGEKVVGVLDLQSRVSGSLNQDDLLSFEALAGQLAIAIQNANLLIEAEQARAEVEKQARRLVRQNWSEHLDAIYKPEQVGFVFEGGQVLPLAETQTAAGETETEGVLFAPIAVTGEALGSLVVEVDENREVLSIELVDIVARQVAQQIENLRLLESAERYRFEAERASRRQTREGWQEYVNARSNQTFGYLYDLTEVRAIGPEGSLPDEENMVTLPLKIRDETIGQFAIQGLPTDDLNSLALAADVAERLSAHIENLRLSEQTRTRAEREQALRQITSAIRGSTDPAIILRTAVRELGTLLGRKTLIRVTTSDQDSQSEPSEQPTSVTSSDEPTASPSEQANGGTE